MKHAFISMLTFATTERPITIGAETYTLRLKPLACDPKLACGTVFVPRRFRGEVFKDGSRVGLFDRGCVGVCEDLEKTVERAVRK